MAAAFALARTLPEDQIVVVQETEYTGAGKHPMPQLTFARQNGVEVRIGDPEEEVPGKNIVLPDHPSRFRVREHDLSAMRRSALKRLVQGCTSVEREDLEFILQELNADEAFVKAELAALSVSC